MLHSDLGAFFALTRIDRRHYPQSRQNTPKHFWMQRRWKRVRVFPCRSVCQRWHLHAGCLQCSRQSTFQHRPVPRISPQVGQAPDLPNEPHHWQDPERRQIAGIENTHHQQAVQVSKQHQPKVLNAASATPTKQHPPVLGLQTTESLDHQSPCLHRHDALPVWPGQRSHPHHLCVQQLFSYRHATMRKSVPLTMGLTCLLSRLISTKP